MTEYNALATLAQKQSAKGEHRIKPPIRIEGAEDDSTVVLSFPLRELQKARPGTGQRRSVGFAMAPVEFTLPGGTTFQLSSPWITISAR